MTGYEKFEKLIEVLGVETVLDDLLQALNSNELEENAEYIGRMRDVEFEEVE